MAGLGEHGQAEWGRVAGSRSARATNLASRSPATTSTGMVELAQPVPQRFLGAGAGQAQAGGQAGGGVGQAGVAVGPAGGEPGEQGLGQPLVEEGGDAEGQHPVGQRLVCGSAGGPLVGVVDAGGAADQHEAPHPLGPGQGQRAGPAGPPWSSRRRWRCHPWPPGRRRRRAGRARGRWSHRGRARRPAPGRARRATWRRAGPSTRAVWVKPCTSTRRSLCARRGGGPRPRRCARPGAARARARAASGRRWGPWQGQT